MDLILFCGAIAFSLITLYRVYQVLCILYRAMRRFLSNVPNILGLFFFLRKKHFRDDERR